MEHNVEIAASYRFARSVTRRSGSTFRFGFGLLPREQADAMHALYAFCRLTDDIADGDEPVDEKRRRLDDWRAQLNATLNGRPERGIWPALGDAARRFDIDATHFRDQIAGNRWDLDGTPISTHQDLERYMDLVAGSVGMACLAIWGCREPAAIEPARAAGRAMQLTNILRDLKEDAERGRVYISAEEIDRVGCPPSRWQPTDPAFQSLMSVHVERANGYFSASSTLTTMLSASSRRVFRLFQNRYRAILDEIVRRRYDVFSCRVRVGRMRTLGLIAKSLIS